MFSFSQILAAIGGTTVLVYALIAIFMPSILVIATPIVTNLVSGIAAFFKYLWTGFLYLSQSVPAMFLLVCVCFLAYSGGKITSKANFVNKLHQDYSFVPKKQPIQKRLKSEIHSILLHPLG